MAFWFVQGLRRGVVTTRYPATEPDPWTRALPTPPAFVPELLTPALVDELAAACPSGALAHVDDTLVIDLGACSACGRCLSIAGQAARPSGLLELAARRRADLVKHIPIAGGE